MAKYHYFFDPLCGWCYGSTIKLAKLLEQGAEIELLPSGLFSQTGRVIDVAFADYAWQHDMRIAQVSGATFSEAYRQNVFGDIGQPLDSYPAYVAVASAEKISPQAGVKALIAIMQARWRDGRNITDYDVLKAILNEQGLSQAADFDDPALLAELNQRIQATQQMMMELGLSGVPQLFDEHGETVRLF